MIERDLHEMTYVFYCVPCLFLRFKSAFEKIWNFFIFLFFSLLQINIFLVFSDHFDTPMSKMIF
jgi:hypothetical protein